jgi:RNA polymerase sigma factor FliA
MVRRVGTRVATLDDLKGFGREGLLDAARRYRPSQGPFGAWARQRIRGAILDGLGQWGVSPRVWRQLQAAGTQTGEEEGRPEREGSGDGPAEFEDPEAGGDRGIDTRLAELVMAVGGRGIGIATVDAKGRTLSGPESGSPEEQAMRSELVSLLLEVVATLPAQEKELVERYYFKEETLEEAAAAMGIGTPRASRVRGSAMERIERGLRARDVDGWSFLRLLARRT